MDNDSPQEVIIINQKDLALIKHCGFKYWEEKIPKGLGRDSDLQIYLIIRGFKDYLESKGVTVPVEFDF